MASNFVVNTLLLQIDSYQFIAMNIATDGGYKKKSFAPTKWGGSACFELR